jgi:type II secretory pathway pseudopilin PulG
MKKRVLSDSGGFTLLEISLVVVIGFMMLTLATPTIRGLFAEQRLRDRMHQFEEFVHRAGVLAKSTRGEVRLIWEKGGVRMVTEVVQAEESPLLQGDAGGAGAAATGGEFFPVDKEEGLSLVRLAARDRQPLAEWSFWPAGVREPVEIYFAGTTGRWALRFNALVPDPEEISVEAY